MPSLQTVEVVEAQEKDAKLQGLLAKHHKSRTNRILIFVLYKKEAARVEGTLHRKGWKVQHYSAAPGMLAMCVRRVQLAVSHAQHACKLPPALAIQHAASGSAHGLALQEKQGWMSTLGIRTAFASPGGSELHTGQSLRFLGGVLHCPVA